MGGIEIKSEDPMSLIVGRKRSPDLVSLSLSGIPRPVFQWQKTSAA